PAVRLVHVIGREGRGRPVVPVGASFRIDEKTIHQSEALRQRAMIRRNVLRRPVGRASGFARAEDRQTRIAISLGAVAGLADIAEDLIIGAIFLDDVNYMLDRIRAGKQPGFHLTDQAVVAQDLRSVAVQPPLVGNVNQAQIARNQRTAVLPALPAPRRETVVRRVGRAARVVDDHGRVFHARAFSVPDNETLPYDGDRSRILTGRNKTVQLGFLLAALRERDDGDGVAVRIGDEKRLLVRAEREAFRATTRQGAFGETRVDAFDFPVRRRVYHRDAVGVRVYDVQTRLRGVEDHCRRVAVHRNAPDRLARIVRIVRVNHRQRGVIPARDVHFGRFAVARGQNRDAVWIYGLQWIVTPQIHANEFARPAQVANNAQAIAEVVGDKERLAVRAERQARRVNGREISVVSRRGRLRGKAIDVNERRFDASVRPRRRRSDRRARARGEPEHPDFVLDGAGDIQQVASVLLGLGCERDADTGALRRGEINILDHDGRGLRIQINDSERLLAMIGLGVELEAEAAIDRDQIAAFAVRAVLIG